MERSRMRSIFARRYTMSDILIHSSPQTDAEAEATVHQLLAEISQMDEQINRYRTESERLKFETQVIKAMTETKLTALEEQVSNLSKAN